MYSDYWFDSQGAGRIHVSRWTPKGKVKAVLQIVHGIADYAERYAPFAQFLNERGILVVAEDHMGHGHSIESGIQGYFHGGWFTAVADTYRLLQDTRKEYPAVPYILFGHSMGSFMARTILCQYPDSGISATVICGTCWQPVFAMPAIVKVLEASCALLGEKEPGPRLQGMVFGGYNARVRQPRTPFDWVNRDEKEVDAYVADPFCGFVATRGLLRELMRGIHYIEQKKNLSTMKKDLPVFFIAGGGDPVGAYGKGVETAASAFRKAGMTDVSVKIYPEARHEILNELNKFEVYEDVYRWVLKLID